jgi:hypothetical protein
MFEKNASPSGEEIEKIIAQAQKSLTYMFSQNGSAILNEIF